MIRPPFTAKAGDSGIWIEDADGILFAEINPLRLDDPLAFDAAETLAQGANFLIERRNHARRIAQKAGRPRSKKPSKAALAQRESRARRQKKQ